MCFILYSNNKSINVCERASKQFPDPRILPRRDQAPGFEIPGSAFVLDLKATDFDNVNSKNSVSMELGVDVVPTQPCKHV